ncbi:SprT family zinc-dependent metalloprotease [Vibrio sp. JC009]|uniref:SprT family zinc-dependent metalloprotease n=1 Tax=Vibrio sp. JC009 TaxID=2912314 RepID=UPI0023AFF6EC|nr:SprT family zinc-dependent metalloprotease [Vibrio sp. JC009]WED22213.1 SprT family zinc-dependent metalloprotease [Vibrio sp. JC009]
MNKLAEQKYKDIQDKLSWCVHRAEVAFQRSFELPSVNFKLRGKAAGKAYLQASEIRLNRVLFEENYTAFINEVIPHEVAHLVTFQVFGKVRPHGKEWQMVMEKVFGIPAKTTHSFEVISVQGKTFEYQCSCEQYALSIRRHNKVQRKQANYICKSCRQPLLFTGKQLS